VHAGLNDMVVPVYAAESFNPVLPINGPIRAIFAAAQLNSAKRFSIKRVNHRLNPDPVERALIPVINVHIANHHAFPYHARCRRCRRIWV
jgi:hypothetical protein